MLLGIMMLKFFLFSFFGMLVSYSVFAAFKYTRMIGNIFVSLVYRPPLENLSSTMGERIMILDSSDHEIEAILARSGGAKTCVIFCHESGVSKDSWEKYAAFLPRLGFHVLSMDFENKTIPDVQASVSPWPSFEDVKKLLMVIHWTKKAFDPNINVVLFGISKGADIALAASTMEDRVKAVIADGLFSMREILRDYIRKWGPILVKPNFFGEHYPAWLVEIFSNLGFWYCQKKAHVQFIDVEKFLTSKHPPVLMIHGEEDDYVTPHHQVFLEKLGRSELTAVQRLVIPQAKHNQAVMVGKEIYEERIFEFLSKI